MFVRWDNLNIDAEESRQPPATATRPADEILAAIHGASRGIAAARNGRDGRDQRDGRDGGGGGPVSGAGVSAGD